MELDASFVCPHCLQRIRMAAEYDEGKSIWKFDIRAVERTERKEFAEEGPEGEGEHELEGPEEEEENVLYS